MGRREMRRVLFPIAFALVASLAAVIFLPRSTPSAPAHRLVGVLDTDRLKAYSSIGQLAADSAALVEFTATSATVTDLIGATQVPFTVTTVADPRTLQGTTASRPLKIRQLGGTRGNVVFSSDVPLLLPGATYVAFVQKFTFGPGHDTDQYVITGDGAGLFRVLDRGVVSRVDPDSTQLPATLTLTELVSQAAGG